MTRPYGISGFAQNPTRRPEICQFLIDRMEAVGTQIENYPLNNCGEFNAINNALSNGAKIGDLKLYSVAIKEGTFKEACKNCSALFEGFVQFIGG
ncbi:MAG: hypothetical protein ACM3UZ_10290 [Acidobacteriota bacterium]